MKRELSLDDGRIGREKPKIENLIGNGNLHKMQTFLKRKLT
ncbi:hypothetical protein LEP1GSC202_2541 [Leptospira yanagawae serovar Saopaulo str. Sao Paulo = ATCC 700523]|uniref:Uncharacterized protein n=1 Tax=Leptospira yanagawae serovar Saopaulo str. Sao Paulo = ATCC 700523 TaxID=1249483 RepID=A0A5E8H6T1_9LEPT|nr:hypothetical protein LEP1GSC202_2541 [Leptospira yanagawae serovar Saopaulo str. Sao Paulo = ATCC 700523]